LVLTGLSACGDEDRDGEPGASPPVSGDDSTLTLEVAAPGEASSGAPVTWVLRLVNHSDRPIGLVCPTGQDAEVELSRDGSVRYRWSNGRSFTQAVRHVPVEPGSVDIELGDASLDVPPGDYRLEATVPCDPEPPPARVELTVTE